MEAMLLTDSIKQLEKALLDFTEALRPDDHPAFIAIQPGLFEEGEKGLELARAGIRDIFTPKRAMDGRFTPICVGAIGVDERVLEKAKYVNTCKDYLKGAVDTVTDRLFAGQKSRAGKSKAIRSLLRDLGWGSLSLRLCYRHLPIIEYQPKRIGFSYSSGGRSIKKMTILQAIQFVHDLDRENYEVETSENGLKSRITIANLMIQRPDLIVAHVQPLAGYYKANIFNDSNKKPKTLPAYLPVIYLRSDKSTVSHTLKLPEKNDWRRIAKEENRIEKGENPNRSDKKLRDEPFIESLNLYVYE